ncbi:MAG: thiamine pyrophosphate-dependent dehydrogenase E1 component subunit alpha [Planctomycetota bacterium]
MTKASAPAPNDTARGEPAAGGRPAPDAPWLRALFGHLVRTRCIDRRMVQLQRTGRVAFVGPVTGMEAAILGTAAALEPRDWLWSGLREGPAALLRGMPLDEYVGQMFGRSGDTGRGRQMPNHFQHRGTNFPSWSSVIGTQIPHGVGAALAARRRGLDEVHAIYFGDGATSSNGFHSGLNLAAVWKVPAVFVCIHNGWAISVPSHEQSAVDSFADKAPAYGMPGHEVDGNDILGCHVAMRELVERARGGAGPALLVARTYRLEGHSSADDPSRYRAAAEVEEWARRDPLARFQRLLFERGVLAPGEPEAIERAAYAEIDAAIRRQEAAPDLPLPSLVEDVFAGVPAHLRRQYADYLDLLSRRGPPRRA